MMISSFWRHPTTDVLLMQPEAHHRRQQCIPRRPLVDLELLLSLRRNYFSSSIALQKMRHNHSRSLQDIRICSSLHSWKWKNPLLFTYYTRVSKRFTCAHIPKLLSFACNTAFCIIGKGLSGKVHCQHVTTSMRL